MKLPRDISGPRLARRLERLGYRATRTTGSHTRLTCDAPTQHHVTIPNHDALRIGTLASILSNVASHHKITRDDLVKRLFQEP